MEVKINREIRNYTESMFFGLSLRQFIFSVLACAVAVGLYFLLKPYLGTETVSWVCILGAAPFAALGFVKYNGMTAEKFIWAWIKSEFLMPKKLVFHSTNTYYELMKSTIEQKQKIKKPTISSRVAAAAPPSSQKANNQINQDTDDHTPKENCHLLSFLSVSPSAMFASVFSWQTRFSSCRKTAFIAIPVTTRSAPMARE